jgi:epoxyqueuosine reductase
MMQSFPKVAHFGKQHHPVFTGHSRPFVKIYPCLPQSLITRSIQMKEEIRNFGLALGADAVGFASIRDYRSARCPDPNTILEGVKSQKNAYLMARHVETKYGKKAAPVLFSYPLNMGPGVMGMIGDLSLRHAAVAAGLGVFGRHNLVIHPKFGSRIVFTAVLTQLPLDSDPPVTEELCNSCGICVDACPAKALDEEGRTDQMKCLRISQPFGIGGAIGYIRKFLAASPEDQKKLLMDPQFLSLYQASFIGFQYNCFRCLASCPACL